MKLFSTALLLAAGFAIAPYMVGLTDHFIPRGPTWFPYVVVLIFSGVLWAVGVDVLRPIAAAIVIGTVLFALGQQYYPQRLEFFGVDAPPPF
jgi:hypothetical protein